MEKLKIGISIGDINGVGLEVILKTLTNPKIAELCTPVVYGSSKVVSYHKNIVDIDFHFQSLRNAERPYEGRVNIVNCWSESVNITLGKPTDLSGKYAIKSLETAVNDLNNGLIDALVTAPINKEAMKLAGFPFPGHTEYLSEKMGGSESLMFMVSEGLRIGLVTNHLPLSEVAEKVTKSAIITKLKIMDESLKKDFGIERPTIAVLGLNPHASDNSTIGQDEEKIIRPAVVESKKKGLMVVGPFAADGFFGSGNYKKFDGILAMYHDQGLIPFKLLSFGKGINYTAGLSGVRTSPDHGTGYDIVGSNAADPSSFRQALFAAIDIARARLDYEEMHANPLSKSRLDNPSEDEVVKNEG